MKSTSAEQVLPGDITVSKSIRLWNRVALLACVVLVPAYLVAAERRAAKSARVAGPVAESVDMFDAMKSQDIDVKLIPKDDKESRVLIKNNTDKPLNVRLPEAFAGVPVLAQARGGGGAAGGVGGGGQQQAMGGGMGGMGGGMGMGGMGGGMMNIPAEKVAQFKVATVCLEHGKKEPRPAIPYEIKPLESVTTKPEIRELLSAFGRGRLNQRATQAAAWHLANGMTWEQLANKRVEHLDGSSEMWFGPQEIQAAMQIAQNAISQAAIKSKTSPDSVGSLNPSLSKTE
jgi:hypothetical protein